MMCETLISARMVQRKRGCAGAGASIEKRGSQSKTVAEYAPASMKASITLGPPRSNAQSRAALNSSRFFAGRRSEERRVGKECRSRRSPYHYKKKRSKEHK